ncbi:MAG: hypothetical protein NDI94_03200 [Candidatus Woesearchaeota archaeon]|nr:hypothetical protein [Candidatus Woesearchaeota archaeon]
MQIETLRKQIIERAISSSGVVYEFYGPGYVMQFIEGTRISKDESIVPYGTSVEETVKQVLGFHQTVGFVLGDYQVYQFLQEVGKFSPTPSNATRYQLSERDMHVFWGNQPEPVGFIKEFVSEYPELMPLTSIPTSLGKLDYVVQINENYTHAFESVVFRPEGGIVSIEGSKVLTVNGSDRSIVSYNQPDRSRYGLISKNNFYLTDKKFFETLERQIR